MFLYICIVGRKLGIDFTVTQPFLASLTTRFEVRYGIMVGNYNFNSNSNFVIIQINSELYFFMFNLIKNICV